MLNSYHFLNYIVVVDHHLLLEGTQVQKEKRDNFVFFFPLVLDCDMDAPKIWLLIYGIYYIQLNTSIFKILYRFIIYESHI